MGGVDHQHAAVARRDLDVVAVAADLEAGTVRVENDGEGVARRGNDVVRLGGARELDVVVGALRADDSEGPGQSGCSLVGYDHRNYWLCPG